MGLPCKLLVELGADIDQALPSGATGETLLQPVLAPLLPLPSGATGETLLLLSLRLCCPPLRHNR